jgi:hypothetical protein
MFYTTIEETNALTYWNMILSNSPVPVIMGLEVDHSEVNESLSQQLSWVDQALNSSQHSNLAGFSIWAYDYWSTTDFTAWANWPTKGPVPSPTSTSLDATIVTAAIITILAVVVALLFKKKAKKTAEPKEPASKMLGKTLMTLPNSF